MNLDSLLPNLGEWLRGTGPESDVVVSTRIRLARNLADYPFTNRATNPQKAEIVTRAKDAIAKADLPYKLEYLDVPTMPALDRQFLVERQLISRELAAGSTAPAASPSTPRNRSASWSTRRTTSASRCSAAASPSTRPGATSTSSTTRSKPGSPTPSTPQFGYLTACPTNVGTGMRASVMLHLPALVLTKQIEKVFRALQKINLAVRGLYGEGQPGLRRLLPDLQPGDARQERVEDPRRDPRGDPDDPAVRAAGPARRS